MKNDFEEESRLFYLYVPETGTKGNDYDWEGPVSFCKLTGSIMNQIVPNNDQQTVLIIRELDYTYDA